MKTARTLLAALGCLCLVTATSHAQVPQIISYQGRVAVGATNFNGTGSFKFALVQGAGPTLLWKNDGSAGNTEPATAVSLTVTKGLYSVLLGDISLGAGMTAIPASVFANSDVRLRVWFNDGTTGSQLLTPDQRLAAVGYAMVAGSVPDGSITSAKIATGAVTNTQLATNAVQAANIAVGAVGSTQIGNLSIATGNLANSSVTAAKLGSDVGLWSVNGGDVFRSGGNVGIGTASPTNRLTVGGETAAYPLSLRILPTSHATSRRAELRFGDWSILQDITGDGTQNFALFDYSSSAHRLVVSTAGNVGIGTTTPSTKLQVAGTVTATAFSGPLTGNVSGSAGSFTGSLAGDVTGAQGTTVVANVGGVTAANVATGANLANAATTANTPNTIVKRDASGTIPASAVATAPPGMVLIPAGAFTMGNSVAADTDITNAAPVSTTVSAFYMDVNEVTLSQWQSVYYWAKDNGYTDLPAGSGKGPNHPVQTVSWYACVKWCNARSEQAGKTPVYYTNDAQTTIYKTGSVNVTNVQVKWTANGYRLPTEAEWEKAARGGRSGQRFPWGNTITQNLANYSGDTGSYAYDLGPNGYNAIGSIGGTSPATSPVGSFAANGYGLNDMAGNVFQWCWDWYPSPYTPYAGGSDPYGPATGSSRVLRGGTSNYFADFARCAFRYYDFPAVAYINIGFRAVLPPGQP